MLLLHLDGNDLLTFVLENKYIFVPVYLFTQAFFLKKFIMKYFSLLFFLLFTSLSISQAKVSGLIMDGEYDEPMAFANVIVKRFEYWNHFRL